MTAEFRVLTFVTDHDLYATFRASFEAGGFGAATTVYETVDNGGGNVGDPYTVLNDRLDTMSEPYLIVCHQDVLLADGTTVGTLERALAQADRAYPEWGVAGSAGLDMRYEHATCVDDPWHSPRSPGPWPVEAEVLDELLLVVRPGRARLTAGLSGFHFYAADLCASTRRKGGVAVIVDFPLRHLSDGEGGRLSEDYRAARNALQGALSPLYRFRILMAITSEAVVLSRYPLVRRFADRERVRRLAVRLLGRRMVP